MRREFWREPQPDMARTAAVMKINGDHRARLDMRTIPQSIWNLAQRQMRGLALWLILAGIAAPGWAFQAEHPLSGRRIAPVMGVGGADWLERNEREQEEHPDAALDAIGLKPGMVVADVGAGTGFMSLKMAARVG